MLKDSKQIKTSFGFDRPKPSTQTSIVKTLPDYG
jgi:hypothetical protein